MQQYLKANPFDGMNRNVESVLEYLTECYLEEHPISSEKIKKIQDEMTPYYEDVPYLTSERLFCLVYDLCSAYENAAFRDGLLVGLHLRSDIDSVRNPTK